MNDLAQDSGARALSSSAESSGAKARPWLILVIICIPVFVGSLDLTVVSAFLPELILELRLPADTGLADVSWILTSYLMAYTISLSFVGRLSDLAGRRRIYVASLLVFIAGSVLVAVAHQFPADWLITWSDALGEPLDPAYAHLYAIIFGRVIQALGAGALVPVSLALVGDLFPPEKRTRPLGLVAAVDSLGWVMGSLYGGLFIQIMPWQGLFWMNVPLTLLALFLTLWALRGVQEQRVSGRFDILGTVFIALALACLNIGLGANVDTANVSNLEELAPLPEYAGPVLLVGLVAFIAFILVELRVKDPLINLRMFLRRNLSTASIANLLIGYALFIGLVSVPILVNLIAIRDGGFDTLTDAALVVGLLLSTLTIPMAVAAVPGGMLGSKIGLRNTILLGLLIALVGFVLIWQTWTIDISTLEVALQMALVGIGIGLTFSPVSTAIINTAQTEERGVASALVIILRLIGMTVSVSSLTAYASYRLNQLGLETSAPNVSNPFALLQQAADAIAQGESLMDFAMSLFMPSGVTPAQTVQILAEMGLIGALVCLAALVPVMFLSNRIE